MGILSEGSRSHGGAPKVVVDFVPQAGSPLEGVGNGSNFAQPATKGPPASMP